MARIKVSVVISIFYRIVATFSSLDILIKDNCNVYYAVKSVNEIEFILRPKEMQLDNDVNNANNGYNHSNSNSSNSTAANIFHTIPSSLFPVPGNYYWKTVQLPSPPHLH